MSISTDMAVSGESEPKRTIPYIPLKVQIKIAQWLDLESARSLSTTCKALRDAGEIKVWEMLDLTSGWCCKSAVATHAAFGDIVGWTRARWRGWLTI